MSIRNIFLRSSDLSKLTGHNKYDPLEKTINTILSNNKIEERVCHKSNIEELLHKLSPPKLSSLTQELDLPEGVDMGTIEKKITQTIMGNSYSKKITEEESRKHIDDHLHGKTVLQSLEIGIKQDLRMKRGEIKESSNLNKIQSQQGSKILQRNSSMYVKELYACDKYRIIVRGKVDGIMDDTIIESKNRANYLFKTLRGYEQVQLESYMFLTGLQKAILTEHYNDTEYCINYSHDQEFWESCRGSIISFIESNISEFI